MADKTTPFQGQDTVIDLSMESERSMVPKQMGESSQPQAKESRMPGQAKENPSIQPQELKAETSSVGETMENSEIDEETEEKPEMIVQLMLQQSACIAQQQYELVQLRKERDELKQSLKNAELQLKKRHDFMGGVELLTWDQEVPPARTDSKTARRSITFRKKFGRILKLELAKRREVLMKTLSLGAGIPDTPQT